MSCSGLKNYRNIVRIHIGNSVLEMLKQEGYEENIAYQLTESLLYLIDFNRINESISLIYEEAKKRLKQILK